MISGANDSKLDSGWGGGAFIDKHRWVFPLVPTACAYTKLDEYFRKMQKHQIEVLQTQGDFSETQEVRKVSKSKQNRERNRMEKIYEYYFRFEKFNSKLAYASSTNDFETGRSFGKRKLKEVEKLFQWGGQVIQFQKERETIWRIGEKWWRKRTKIL